METRSIMTIHSSSKCPQLGWNIGPSSHFSRFTENTSKFQLDASKKLGTTLSIWLHVLTFTLLRNSILAILFLSFSTRETLASIFDAKYLESLIYSCPRTLKQSVPPPFIIGIHQQVVFSF